MNKIQTEKEYQAELLGILRDNNGFYYQKRDRLRPPFCNRP